MRIASLPCTVSIKTIYLKSNGGIGHMCRPDHHLLHNHVLGAGRGRGSADTDSCASRFWRGVSSSSNSSSIRVELDDDYDWWKKLLIKLFRWVAGVAVLAGALVAALPTILSTQSGLSGATKVAGLFLPGSLVVREVDSGWTKPLVVKGIELKESSRSEAAVITVEQITTTAKLMDIVRGKDFEMVVSSPTIDAAPDAQGEIPLLRYAESAGFMKKSQAKKSVPVLAEKKRVVDLSGEVKKGQTYIYVTDGKLYVGDELRYTIGDRLQWLIAQGDQTVSDACEELKISSRWMESPNKPQGSQATLVSVTSPNLGWDLKGWKTSKKLMLAEPMTAFAECTPLLAKEGMGKINPFIGETIKMSKGAKIQVQVDSPTMELPSSPMKVHLDPVQVVVDPGPLTTGILDLLKIKEKGLQEGQPIQVFLSGVDLDVNGDNVDIRRWDMLLGNTRRGVEVVVWGNCNTSTQKIDMFLGLPQSALSRLGVVTDPGYAIVFPIKGTISSPVVDWAAATKDIGSLALERVGGMISSESGSLGGFIRNAFFDVAKGLAGNKSKQAQLPKLTEPLPWK